MVNDSKGTFVIIPGFRKCGTTTLFDWLFASGEFDSFSKKETQLLGLPYSDLIEYIDRLNTQRRQKPLLDGSTFYCHSPHFLNNLKKINSDFKLIIMIRKPSLRFVSAVSHMMAKGHKFEPRTWEEIIHFYSEEKESSKIILKEWEFCHSNEEKGLPVPVPDDYFMKVKELKLRHHSYDPYLGWRYYYESLYSRFINDKLLSDRNTLIISFENMIKETDKTKKKLENFLGIDLSSELPHSNVTVRSNYLIDFLRFLKTLNVIINNKYVLAFGRRIRSVIGADIEKPCDIQMKSINSLFIDEVKFWTKYDKDLTKYWK